MTSPGPIKVGTEIPPCRRVVDREDVAAYAEASGDRNPLHQEDDVARAAGFPGIIAHGMFTMGHLGACLSRWVGDPAAILRFRAQFKSPVFLGDELVAGGRVKAVEDGIATVELWVTAHRDGETEYAIRRAEAEIRLSS
jgi:acyl dehydratase